MQRRHLILPALAALVALAPGATLAADPAAAPAQTQKLARVVSYDDDAGLTALAAAGHTVVYFYAAWCPECRAMAIEMKDRWNLVRPDITLVIADFDRDKALKSRFGVTYQDTFVLLDKTGRPVKSWNGGGVEGLDAHTAG